MCEGMERTSRTLTVLIAPPPLMVAVAMEVSVTVLGTHGPLAVDIDVVVRVE
jgi:hypothetical protein